MMGYSTRYFERCVILGDQLRSQNRKVRLPASSNSLRKRKLKFTEVTEPN